MFELSLRLLCTKKPGTLSRVVRDINLIGLQYQSHKIKTQDKHSLISIKAVGALHCNLESLQELFTQFPEVLEVQQLDITKNGKLVTEFKTTVSESRILASEPLTPAVVLAAEKRMSQILGPASSFIVEMISQDSANAGELFKRLAEELNNQQEREYFLSIIENSD